jgi:integrase
MEAVDLVHDEDEIVVLDAEDNGLTLQPASITAWRAALGHECAVDVRRDHLDTIVRKWRKVGPSWPKAERVLADGRQITWPARDPARVRPLNVATVNRYSAALRRAFKLGKVIRGLTTPLTFPFFTETARGRYLTEDQCHEIVNYLREHDGDAMADLLRLAYLTGIRQGQWLATQKRHVLITGSGQHAKWKLEWQPHEHKAGKKTGKPHTIGLRGEPLAVIQSVWGRRRPDLDHLFHANGKPLTDRPMRAAFKRACKALGIPYGRGKGVIFHDTRHSAVTNFIGAGTGEAVAMSITGHVTKDVFLHYNVTRDEIQEAAFARQDEHLSTQRDTTPKPTPLAAHPETR